MALGSIGRRLAGSRLGVGLPVALGMAAAVNSANPVSSAMEASQEILFGDRDFDRAVLGTDLTPGNIAPLGIPRPGPVGTTLAGTFLGAGFGLVSGGGRGALLGALAGTAMGAAGTAFGEYRRISPYLNGEIMGDAFRKRRDIAAEMNEADEERGYRTLPHSGNNLPYVPQTVVTGSALSNGYYEQSFTGATRRRRYQTEATGDIVFGAYNLRTR